MSTYRPVRPMPLESPKTDPLSPGLDRCILAAILVVHLVLGGIYSIVVPLWEAYDEWGHYAVVRYVAQHGQMPPTRTRVSAENDESHQPPLYYLLAGLVTSPVRTGVEPEPVKNPFGYAGNGGIGGVNRAVHEQGEGFPFSGTSLALHLARWLNVVLSTLLVWLVFLTAREAVPERPEVAHAAAAICAFLPSFLFVGSIVNNDLLTILMATGVVWCGIRLLRRGFKFWRMAGMAVFLVLGLFGKLTMLFVVPFALGVAALALWRSAPRRAGGRALVRVAGLLAVVAALIGVERLARQMPRVSNWELDLVGMVAGLRPLKLEIVPYALKECFETFVARFGWGNIYPDALVYQLAALVGGVGLLGVLLRWVRSRLGGLIGWLGFATISAVGGTAVLAATSGQGVLLQGRYVMVAIAPVVVLLGLGIDQFTPQRARPWPLVVVSTLVLAIGVLSPFLYIRPAYALPRMEAADSPLPQRMTPLALDFDNGMTLLGAAVSPQRVVPGQTVHVELTWSCRAPIAGDYALAVKALDPDGLELASVHSYPGNGSFATSLWMPGDRFTDRYPLGIPGDVIGQRVAVIQVCVFRLQPGAPEGAEAMMPDGQRASCVELGRIALAGSSAVIPNEAIPSGARMGSSATLLAYQLDRSAERQYRITLFWRAESQRCEDCVCTIQLFDGQGNRVAQIDEPPLGGAYPTAAWVPGEVISDSHLLSIPEAAGVGAFDLTAGMYPLSTLQRIPVVEASGLSEDDGLARLGTLVLR